MLTDIVGRRRGLLKSSAIVVGCALGDDAEWLAEQGLACVAVDPSERLIEACRERFPHSEVCYRSLDLGRAEPTEGVEPALFVFESYTLQRFQHPEKALASAAVARLVAHGGSLLVLSRITDLESRYSAGEELSQFEALGLQLEFFEALYHPEDPSTRHIRALFSR
jgi:2-polyprenyl-3-methyl-5-hydroxy-6-metoxy-1,4-benzoquinol methylase